MQWVWLAAAQQSAPSTPATVASTDELPVGASYGGVGGFSGGFNAAVNTSVPGAFPDPFGVDGLSNRYPAVLAEV